MLSRIGSGKTKQIHRDFDKKLPQAECKVDDNFPTLRRDIKVVEPNLKASKTNMTCDTDQAVHALRGQVDGFAYGLQTIHN